MSNLATIARCAAWLSDDLWLAVVDPHAKHLGTPSLERRFDPPGGEPSIAVVSGPADVREDVVVDLRAFLLEHGGCWPPEIRNRFTAFLASLADDGSTALAQALRLARDVLRERLPLSLVEAGAPRVLHIDRLHRITDRAFYVRGWCLAGDAPMTSLTAVAPEGGRVDIAKRLFRHSRPDVAGLMSDARYDSVSEAGFVAYFDLDAPSRLSHGWVFEMRDATEDGVETPATADSDDHCAVGEHLLSDLRMEGRGSERLREHHLQPAITRLQEAREQVVQIADGEDFGTVPVTPRASVVIPLYRRIEFLEQQMAHFANDAEMSECELIYVLDSPEMTEEFLDYAAQVFALYRLAFRVVVLNENGGFSLASNLGASVARGERLLLLNSDVIPAEPGWLQRMVDVYDATPKVGALGPKLLFEDEGLQHAGMFFARRGGGSEWWSEHFFKGLHRDLPAANVARPVPAVTAACLLTEAALYRRLGGLRSRYVQGGYEDSDFCLRLREEGLECWYLPEVELYHLEGQSYPSEARELSDPYNRWLLTQAWGDTIRATMEEFETAQARTSASAAAR